MRLEVTPTEIAATVGEPVTLLVEAYNTTDVIDGYQASLLGLPGQPFSCDPPELSLFPETSGVMAITFRLPASFPAGRRVIGVKLTSVLDPTESTVREVRLDVAPVEAASLQASPLVVTAGRRAEFTLQVANQGNVAIRPRLRASDSLGKLRFGIVPPVLGLGPQETGRARVVATGRRPLFGSPVPHQLVFTAHDLAQPLEAATTFMQKPLVPRGVLTLLSIAAALALWGAVLFLGVDRVTDVVEETQAAQVAAEEEAARGPFADLPGDGGVLGSVAGTVRAQPDSTDATVSLVPVPSETGAAPSGRVPDPVLTPASGLYLIEDVPSPGVYVAVFSKVGSGTQSRLVELKLGEEITGLDVTLVGGSASASGTVSDGDGPVGAATVSADNGQNVITTVTSATDPVGSFILDGLPAPATYAISVAKEGFGTQTQVVELAAGQDLTGLTVTLTEGTGAVYGNVVGSDGEPVAGVLVTVRAGTGTVPTSVAPPPALPPGPVVASDLGPDVLGAAVTLAEGPVGFYAIGDLPVPGTFTVTFQRDGYVMASMVSALSEGSPETSVSPTLRRSTGIVSGVVAQEVVRPQPCRPFECLLPEAQVRVVDQTGSEVRNTTTASTPAERSGRYEISGLPPGSYSVTFSKEGYLPQTVSLVLGEGEPARELNVTLRGVDVAVTGRAPGCDQVVVLLADGRPLDPAVATTPRPDSSYHVRRLGTPGSYVVVFGVDSEARDAVALDLDVAETGRVVDGDCELELFEHPSQLPYDISSSPIVEGPGSSGTSPPL